MTEPKSEIQQAAQPAATEKKTAGRDAGQPASPKNGPATKKRRTAWVVAFIIIILVALSLAAALWYQQRVFKNTTTALLSQVQNSSSAASQASEQAQQALSIAQEQTRQLAALQSSQHKADAQFQSLEQAFQNLTDSGSDLVLVNDVDHLVTIANQQLLLSGNVGNALIALETAQAQLARANRPGLASLQQTINGDLDRLRAASTIDVALLSSQLNELGILVNQASLMVPDDAAPKVITTRDTPAPDAQPNTAQASADAGTWRKALRDVRNWSESAWSSLRQDLGRFINVRRANDPAALLMSPDQARQLRENLRLRVMTAQLALMMRQAPIWTSEMQAVVLALNTRYDDNDVQTQKAVKLATRLAQTSIAVKLPTVDNSMQALESLRAANARAAEQKAMQPSAEQSSPDADSAAPAGGAQPTKPQE